VREKHCSDGGISWIISQANRAGKEGWKLLESVFREFPKKIEDGEER
jgi:hypothetical protein